MYKLAIIIPTYNHHEKLAALCHDLAPFNLACIMVDDGSDQKTKEVIQALELTHDFLSVIEHTVNKGKGVAVISACKKAYLLGFTHALQFDADYQHDINDITRFIELSQTHPNQVISGQPVFGKDAPVSRVFGRKITTFWVAIETLSLSIKDAMCGFRVYPIKPLISLSEKSNLGHKMEFDTEVLVRLVWLGISISFLPTQVRYPKGNLSNFKLFRDNFRIFLMHAKLVSGMLPHVPLLIRRFRK